jgi:drug/metabolite transporter (DMT)-like permease
VIFALTSALVWGSGDFGGGLATRRGNQFQVLVLSTFSGIVLLLLCAAAWGESLPGLRSAMWAALAGVAGTLGLASLYRGLSLGYAASVAPVAAVVSAALPVVFSIVTEGVPAPTRLAGLALALLGIWLVSATSGGAGLGAQGVGLALLAGLGFGGFFILIGQVEPGALFSPLVVARGVSLSMALLLLWGRRQSLPSIPRSPIALLAGMLDAGGNVFYLLARQHTRLDIAAVLSSLYPVTTVLLASLVLKERVSPLQWLGAAVCLAAVVLIAL